MRWKQLFKQTNREIITPPDGLNIQLKKGVRVFCRKCRQHLYYLRLANRGASLANLVKLPGAKEVNTWCCPLCGQDIVEDQQKPKLLTDKGDML